MRFASLVFVALLIGCSSDDKPADTGPKVNACASAGGVCQANFPFKCAPGNEPSTDSTLATACGKSIGENPIDVPCCFPSPPEDTGTPDTGAMDAVSDATDGATDATGETSTDATSDASTDATSLDAADGD